MTRLRTVHRAGRTLLCAPALLATAVALALAGCASSDGGGGPATPAGFQQTKTPDFNLAVPDGWRIAEHEVGDGSGDKFVVARPRGADVNRAELRAASKHDYGGDINGATLLFGAEISTRRPGAKRVLTKAIDVSGAADARRIEFTVPAGGRLAAARIVTVLALTDARTLVNVTIGVGEDDPVTRRIDGIVGSLKVG